MKLTKIIATVKGRYIETCRMDGVTWISDGSAAYPLYGMPTLTKDALLALMETPEKERDAACVVDCTWTTDFCGKACFDDDDKEMELVPVNMQIVVMGVTLIPYMCEGNVVFVNQKYLKPFATDKKEYRPFLRVDSNGALYVVMKEGFFVKGVVYPSPAGDVAERIAEMARCIVLPKAENETEQERLCDED